MLATDTRLNRRPKWVLRPSIRDRLAQQYIRLSQTTMVDSIHWQSSEMTSQQNHSSLKRPKPE